MATRRLLISGKVQGVFYRGWTETTARSLGLGGWVRNLSNGDVEVLASGPQDKLDELVDRCWEGPPAAAVRAILVQEADTEPMPDFCTRPTV